MGFRALLAVVLIGLACNIPVAERTGDQTIAACGDSKIDPGEVCDDGNQADGDGCSADCKSDESCGNGVVDQITGETCDDGNLHGGDGCSEDCKSDESCGNGVQDLAKGETCDDGNLVGGDGCSANCQSNESCGNGVTDMLTMPPEECDDGVTGSAACDVNCTLAKCGDGTVNMLRGEECDDANTNNGDACDNSCHNVVCGNSRVDGNEQCDDGNSVTTDACVQCKNAFCGDGFKHIGVEQCDDGNTSNNDACTTACKTAFCGDGFLRTGVEQCEDGNTANGDGCDSQCRFEPRVYLVPAAQLINQTFSCDGTGANLYDGCTAMPIGFSWQDTSPFTPVRMTVEFDNGINCAGIESKTTTLNGVASGTFQTVPGNCFCDPALGTPQPGHNLNTWNVTTVTGYVRGGTNTFMLSASPSCFGFSNVLFGQYARVTVFAQ